MRAEDADGYVDTEGPQPFDDVDAAETGQVDVEDDDIWPLQLHVGQRRGTVGSGTNSEARQPEASGERDTDVLIVIDDEDIRPRGG